MEVLKDLKGSLKRYGVLLLMITLLMGVGIIVYYLYLERDSGISMLGIRIASVIGLYTGVWLQCLIYKTFKKGKGTEIQKEVTLYISAVLLFIVSIEVVFIGIIIWRMWALKLFFNIFMVMNIVTFIIMTKGILTKVTGEVSAELLKVNAYLFSSNVLASVLILMILGRAFQPSWVPVVTGIYLIVFFVIYGVKYRRSRTEFTQDR